MLAAKTAWVILESEHRHMRRLLDDIAAVVDGDDWRSGGAQTRRLQRLLCELETFDHDAHRPKGATMFSVMSGRSAPADAHLQAMTDGRSRGDDVLKHAKAVLGVVLTGDRTACHACKALLAGYRDLVLMQMHEEETLLRAHAEEVLTEDEWSRVVSDISSRLGGGVAKKI